MRAHAIALTLLERHGVVTKGAVAAERIPGGFCAAVPGCCGPWKRPASAVAATLSRGSAGAQFALPGAVDRMRALAGDTVAATAAGTRLVSQAKTLIPARAVVLAAADPAQPYGAALPWPSRPEETASSHRPGRKAGAVVVLFAANWCCTSSAAQDAAVLDRRPGRP